MNEIFNIKRFGLVLSKDIQEKGKKYLLQFLTMVGIMTIGVIWYYYTERFNNDVFNYDNKDLLTWACILFLIFGLIFSSTFMDSMREKTERISTLTTPASDFEKFFSRWLIVTVGFVIAFFAAFWMADIVRVAFLSFKYPTLKYPTLNISFLDLSGLIAPKGGYSGNYLFVENTFGMWVFTYALLQSLFILGATFWQKLSFVKTFAAIGAIVILFIFLNKWVIEIFFGNFNRFSEVLNTFLSNPSHEATLKTASCIFAFFTAINWIIAYFRFRESEIIKRL
jgi:hypothetical protein